MRIKNKNSFSKFFNLCEVFFLIEVVDILLLIVVIFPFLYFFVISHIGTFLLFSNYSRLTVGPCCRWTSCSLDDHWSVLQMDCPAFLADHQSVQQMDCACQ